MTNDMYQQVAKIKVFGVGGAGCNAINRMVDEGLQGVEFYVANTDLQVLNVSLVKNKIVLGKETTKGLGAGANPDIGREAALETEDEIREAMQDADMVFITAGLGGGTGTGAAPVFARLAQEAGALTVGIVTKPFTFEGMRRTRQATEGLEDLKQYTDSLIIVSNNRLLEVIGQIPFRDAFKEADNVLRQGVQTITDLIAVPALINLDFADVKSVMENQGSALIGIGMASGEKKAIEAAQSAITSPLLEAQIEGASKAIINVTGGDSITIYDANDAVEYIRNAAGRDIDIIFGVAINEQLEDSIIVTVIATGFEEELTQEESLQRNSFPHQEQSSFEEIPVDRVDRIDEEQDDNNIPSFFKK